MIYNSQTSRQKVGPFTREYILAMLYLVAAALSAVTVVSVTRVWTHWSKILDTCIDIRCGCILYAIKSLHLTAGGDSYLCRFASYSSIPVLILALGLAVYHIFRACSIKTKIATLESMYRYHRRNGGDIVLTAQHQQPVDVSAKPDWRVLALISGLVAILLAANAAVLTEGYYDTCGEFRATLAKALTPGTPSVAASIRERITCQAVFDILDFMDPDILKNLSPDANKEYYGGNIIDTAYFLEIGIVSAWLNLFVWIFALVFNSSMGHKLC